MAHCIKIILIIIATLLFCSPCLASKSRLRVFDTDYFTINLPLHMRKLSSRELPSPENKDKYTFAFMESNKAKKKSILLIISLEKIDDSLPNDLKDRALRVMTKTLQDTAADDPKCQGRTSKSVETRIGGQKGYYFERRSENCLVTLEQYWVTINGNHAYGIYLVRPGKSDGEVARQVVDEISKIKLKIKK
jgi:hypothetical protein